MKKVLFIAALFCSMAAYAQQFGVIGGLNLTSIDGLKNPKEDSKNMTLFNAGVLYKVDLGAGFAVQPTLTYQVKGSDANLGNNIVAKSKTGFVEFSVGAQWGPDLMAFRPYVFVEPYVGYGVTGKETIGWSKSSEDLLGGKYNEALAEAKNKLEYGLGAGVGLEIMNHVQLSCQLFRNLGPLYKKENFESGTLTTVKSAFEGLKSYQGVKINLAILF